MSGKFFNEDYWFVFWQNLEENLLDMGYVIWLFLRMILASPFILIIFLLIVLDDIFK